MIFDDYVDLAEGGGEVALPADRRQQGGALAQAVGQGLAVEHLLIQRKEIPGHVDGSEVVTDIFMAFLPVVLFHVGQGSPGSHLDGGPRNLVDTGPYTVLRHPSVLGNDKCCQQLKTRALLDHLAKHGFDAAFGGARRDEEKSRAKERVYSFRNQFHQWDPKNQRPELWNLYNARINKGESIRVFPLSNWTELDIWLYLLREEIPIVPLYYAKERPVVERDGVLIMVDDERMPLKEGEKPEFRKVRFRTLGCYPLTGAVESNAETVEEIVQEMLLTTTSERQGRVIDDDGSSMEDKKKDGYF